MGRESGLKVPHGLVKSIRPRTRLRGRFLLFSFTDVWCSKKECCFFSFFFVLSFSNRTSFSSFEACDVAIEGSRNRRTSGVSVRRKFHKLNYYNGRIATRDRVYESQHSRIVRLPGATLAAPRYGPSSIHYAGTNAVFIQRTRNPPYPRSNSLRRH